MTTAAIPAYTVIRGRRVPLTARGILPAFHCHHCGLRHATPAITIACFRTQAGI